MKDNLKNIARRIGLQTDDESTGRDATPDKESVSEESVSEEIVDEEVSSTGKVLPENFVWVFGTGRSGSTWISKMLRDLRGYSLWNEPLVGHMLGHLYHERGDRLHESPQFLLGGDKDLWLPPVREFLLSAATAKYPHHTDDPRRFLIVKEPHGSIGADIISEALPESRFVVLLRDPRDVISSKLDAHRPGNWAKKGGLYEKLEGDETNFVGHKASGFLRDMENAFRGYERHPGPKAIVRYEDFRADPEVHLKRLLDDLKLPVRKEIHLTEAIEKNDWENIPEDQKGPGKIRRKAKPGGWNEDLTPEQIQRIEDKTGNFLREYYPETFSG